MDPPPLKEFPGSRGNRGTGQSSISITHLKRCPGACADWVLSRPLGDSRCHGSHPPPPGLLTTRCPRPSAASPLATRLRLLPPLRKRPPARPTAAGSSSGRSPPSRPPARCLTSSSGSSSSSFSRSRRRYSRPKRHFRSSRPSSSALHLCRAEVPPLGVKGRSRFRPRGTVLPSRSLTGCLVPAAAASRVREAPVTTGVDGRHGQGSRQREGPAPSRGAL